MGLKKKLGMGIATALLGAGLISGGVFAYFSDTATQTNTFASGTIDLDVDPTVAVDVDNLKPGDYMPRTFELQNNGSLNMSYVSLSTEYTVKTSDGDVAGNALTDEYAAQIIVEFLNNTTGDEDHEVLFEVSLYDLKNMTLEDLATMIDIEKVWVEGEPRWMPLPLHPDGGIWGYPMELIDVPEEVTGIQAGDTAEFEVQFRFNDTGEAQNELQGLSLELEWTFEGFQDDGEER